MKLWILSVVFATSVISQGGKNGLKYFENFVKITINFVSLERFCFGMLGLRELQRSIRS